MNDQAFLPRKVMVFAILLPLAAFVGYLLSSPDFGSLSLVGLLFVVLLMPLFLRWHHAILVFTWSLPVNLFFLPGSPPFWMLAAAGSLGITLLGAILNKNQQLIHVPSVFWWLMAFGAVVIFTMAINGGFGVRSFGSSSYGGKKYFFLLFTIMAYAAICAHQVPRGKESTYIAMFLLPPLATFMSNLVYMAGPGLWFLYYLFPVDSALLQAQEDFGGYMFGAKFQRLGGLAVGGLGIFSFMLARYGIRGILDWTKPWRLVLLLGVVAVSLLGGFRSVVVIFAVLFAIQYLLEGLLRTRTTLFLAMIGALGIVFLISFARHLPLSIQRSLSVLPIEVDAAARADAKGSSEWRMQMWQVLIPEIPKYFWIGKGYTASAADYYFAAESGRRGLAKDYEVSLVAGDYHNGPLSLIIPFGIWGVITFLGFVWAALKVLYLNYKNGPPHLKLINTFLLSAFIGRLIFFFSVFGAISLDLTLMAGLVGLGISMNGGVARKPAAAPVTKSPAPSSVASFRPLSFGRIRP